MCFTPRVGDLVYVEGWGEKYEYRVESFKVSTTTRKHNMDTDVIEHDMCPASRFHAPHQSFWGLLTPTLETIHLLRVERPSKIS